MNRVVCKKMFAHSLYRVKEIIIWYLDMDWNKRRPGDTQLNQLFKLLHHCSTSLFTSSSVFPLNSLLNAFCP